MRYRQIYDGDWLKAAKSHYIKCCDCGLTHRFNFRIIKGRIEFRAFRIKRRNEIRNK